MNQEKNAEAPVSIKDLAIAFAACAAIFFMIAALGIDRIEAGGFWGGVLGFGLLGFMLTASGALWGLLDALIQRFGPGAMLTGGLVFTAVFFSLSVLIPQFHRPGLGLATFGLVIVLKCVWRFLKGPPAGKDG